jgi:hypothetical protein
LAYREIDVFLSWHDKVHCIIVRDAFEQWNKERSGSSAIIWFPPVNYFSAFGCGLISERHFLRRPYIVLDAGAVRNDQLIEIA